MLSIIDAIGTVKSSYCPILVVLHRIIHTSIMKIVHSYEPSNLERMLFIFICEQDFENIYFLPQIMESNINPPWRPFFLISIYIILYTRKF